jgi:CHAT domain-containing protein
MKRTELASCLVEADGADRAELLARHASLLDWELASALEALFEEADGGDPARASRVAGVLTAVAEATGSPPIRALADWKAGIAALEMEGQAETGLDRLCQAAEQFAALQQPLTVAAIQVSLLQALAVLGRYEEALDCGLEAHAVFLAHQDKLAAGKIEQNLGNIFFRRDQYHEAERYYRAARARFATLGDQRRLTQIDTCLATALICQHRFRDAAPLYHQALERAQAAGLEMTQAVIECDLGCLAMFQGRYDQALDYLERSRRRYDALGMPHESAIAELELADAYLELNLAPEADAIYSRIIPLFAELGMRAERARALAQAGRACVVLGRVEAAMSCLSEARVLYAAEGNEVGDAAVMLTEAQVRFLQADYDGAASRAAQAETVLAAAGTRGRQLLARWLRGESARAQGRSIEAVALLTETLDEAERRIVPQIAYYCHTSLGLLAAAAGDVARAEDFFERALSLIDAMRAPLPADEFRTAFVADKLTPYVELTRLCLADGGPQQVVRALGYVERARSRALAEMMSGVLPPHPKPRDSYEAELFGKLDELRGELNWFYNRINRPAEGVAPAGPAAVASLFDAAREREQAMLEIRLQLAQRGGSELPLAETGDVSQLQRALGEDTALVEYFSLDGELLAFVVTGAEARVIRRLGGEAEVRAVLDSFYLQLNSLRHGAERLRRRLPQLIERVRNHLGKLHHLLFRPVEELLGSRRAVIVPHRALHYIPFHALFDGCEYLVERREVCYAPSASVLLHCLERPSRELRRALLLGIPDEQTPRVRDEVLSLAPLFPDPAILLDEQATLFALRERSPAADVLHLACHGQFRHDSPLFSSLRLADGWLTVRDAHDLELNCGLVTLSACETGRSAIAPGDELIGLARGFFSAGAPSLLVSLWKVDDESTAELMKTFYQRLRAGDRPAAALRFAQRELMTRYPHPFFWSPFVLMGRW